MKTRNDILAENPIKAFLESDGVELHKHGSNYKSNRCPLLEHSPKHFCVSIDSEKEVWHCNDCDVGGSVIDWVRHRDGITVAQAMRNLAGSEDEEDKKESNSNGDSKPKKPVTDRPGWEVAAYDYLDAKQNLVFQVVRFEPKDFRQRHRRQDGSWDWTGVTEKDRVLYRLPAVLASDYVWITEGEKDADTVAAFGLCSTTNAGGAEKWLPQYSETLRDKEIIICPDNDAKGETHLTIVRKAIEKIAKSIRVVRIPSPHKDVSDFVASFAKPADALIELLNLSDASECFYRGVSVPIFSMAELEAQYSEFTRRSEELSLDLGKWLPSFRSGIRPLIPGEVMAILAGTGVGKTMVLQQIALSTTIPTLFFELELPGTLLFERFIAMAAKVASVDVFETYRDGKSIHWQHHDRLHEIFVCQKSRLTIPEIEKIIRNSGLKTGKNPVLVCLDYAQLLNGAGQSRYERMSDVMEAVKSMAKATNTIVVIASQIHRKAGAGAEVSLDDGKDSGSIENSSGLVLGVWRDADEYERMIVRVLKNTKGDSMVEIKCRVQQGTMNIVEEIDHE